MTGVSLAHCLSISPLKKKPDLYHSYTIECSKQ